MANEGLEFSHKDVELNEEITEMMFPMRRFCFCIPCFGGLVVGISTLRYGDQLNSINSLVSQAGNFTLGFFTIPETKYTYLDIWYTDEDQFKRVWVANRNTHLLSNSIVLTIDDTTRILQITSRGNTVLNLSDQITDNATATIEDSSNFVLTDHEHADRTLWESFDHPTDMLFPCMKLGFSLEKNWSLTSWLSDTWVSRVEGT